MINKYKGICVECNSIVPANGGELSKSHGKWEVRHLVCTNYKSNRAYATKGEYTPRNRRLVDTITFSSGDSITRNVNGLCEDAPCCGCCT
jgi:hypothetical protein